MHPQILKTPSIFSNTQKLLHDLKTNGEDYWINRGEKRALRLFHLMALKVPAYKDFLKKNKVNHDLIKTVKDFRYIPPIDKNNYLRLYPLEMLCWDGDLKGKRWTVATNSGSTGEPFYFPREIDQDWQYASIAELYLLNNFDIDKKSTLYIDCFAMGAWIGGLFTYEAIRLLAERGKYKLSIFTPGIFKDEILKSVSKLGPKFDQVIIGGYPPFVKDIIDEGLKSGMNWKDYNLGFIFSAEGFSEDFRDYILTKSGSRNLYLSSLNHYGTADMGTMAHETPLTILVRRLAVINNKLFNKLFELGRTPTLVQYIPELFYFESNENILYCSAFSGLPLFRYDLKDVGGIYTFEQVKKICLSEGISLDNEIRKTEITNNVWKLPFVYLYERNDFIVKLYGANIFPETIRRVIQNNNYQKYLTGKFSLVVKYDNFQNQYMEINVELKPNEKASEKLGNQLQDDIIDKLMEENSEYKSNYVSDPQRQKPKIIFWDYESPEYFKPGVKQKWVRN